MTPTPEGLQASGERAVAAFIAELGEDMSTGKFVLLAEVIDQNGDRGEWASSASAVRPDSASSRSYRSRMTSRPDRAVRAEDATHEGQAELKLDVGARDAKPVSCWAR